MAFLERQIMPHVTLRPAAPRDADLLRQWRAETSVRRYQPLNELPTAQLRADVASQRMPDLYRGRGEKFQWIVQGDSDPAGWITLVVSNWERGLAAGAGEERLSKGRSPQGLLQAARPEGRQLPLRPASRRLPGPPAGGR